MRLLTVTDAAKIKGCNRTSVYWWISRGKVNSEKVNGVARVVNDAKFAALQPTRGKREKDYQTVQIEELLRLMVKQQDINRELRKRIEILEKALI